MKKKLYIIKKEWHTLWHKDGSCSMQVITRGLVLFGTGSALGVTYLLIRYIPKKPSITVEQLWSRFVNLNWFHKVSFHKWM